MRLNLYLARAGVASRRNSDELITAGRVKVNGELVTTLGVVVQELEDLVEVDGVAVGLSNKKVTLMMNKPIGVMSTCSDPHATRTVVQLLPDHYQPLRLFPIGRLDQNTTGLLLMSNDGELTHQLTHPSHQIEKVYRVTVRGHLGRIACERLRNGVKLKDGHTLPARVFDVSASRSRTIFRIGIQEGRNRQIRRMCAQLGHSVVALHRETIGGLALGDLPIGSVQQLTQSQLRAIWNPRSEHPRTDAKRG